MIKEKPIYYSAGRGYQGLKTAVARAEARATAIGINHGTKAFMVRAAIHRGI